MLKVIYSCLVKLYEGDKSLELPPLEDMSPQGRGLQDVIKNFKFLLEHDISDRIPYIYSILGAAVAFPQIRDEVLVRMYKDPFKPTRLHHLIDYLEGCVFNVMKTTTNISTDSIGNYSRELLTLLIREYIILPHKNLNC